MPGMWFIACAPRAILRFATRARPAPHPLYDGRVVFIRSWIERSPHTQSPGMMCMMRRFVLVTRARPTPNPLYDLCVALFRNCSACSSDTSPSPCMVGVRRAFVLILRACPTPRLLYDLCVWRSFVALRAGPTNRPSLEARVATISYCLHFAFVPQLAPFAFRRPPLHVV